MKRDRLRVAVIAWLVALAAQSAGQGAPPCVIEQAQLLPSTGLPDDHFGIAVSVFDDTSLIGASADDTKGAKAGAAYLFVRNGATWTEQAKLTASDGAIGDSFGAFTSLSGSTALIGALYGDGKAVDSGAAYVFVRSGAAWSEQAKLTASDGELQDWFGSSVALQGDLVIIGAELDDDRGPEAGAAYVFVRSGVTWTEQAKLTASDGAIGDRFGFSVALAGNTALVGSWRDKTNNKSQAGSAYVFVRNGATWTEQAKLTASDGSIGDRFGVAVSLLGETAIVGSYRADDKATDSGAAYVFLRTGNVWVEQAKLTASDGAAGDYFGVSTSMSESRALIGALFGDGNAVDSGAAYVFTRIGQTWQEQGKLTAAGGIKDDGFGYSASLSGGTAVVGAYEDDTQNGFDSGSATVFVDSTAFCSPKSTLACGIPSISSAGTSSATAPSGFVVRAGPARTCKSGYLVYNIAQVTGVAFHGGVLCVDPMGLRRGGSVNSGGTPGGMNCDGEFAIDMNSFAADTWVVPDCQGNPAGIVPTLPAPYLSVPGTSVFAQYWGRDSVSTGSFVSDGLSWIVCP